MTAGIQNYALPETTTNSVGLATDLDPLYSLLYNRAFYLNQCPSLPIPSLLSKDLFCMNFKEVLLDIGQYRQRLLELEFSDENTIRSFIETLTPPISLNQEKKELFKKTLENTENKELLRILLEKIKPTFEWKDVFLIQHNNEYQKFIPLISDYYSPSDPYYEFGLLDTLFQKLDRKDFMPFWNAHRDYFTNSSHQIEAIQARSLSLPLLKFLREQGADSRLFNVPVNFRLTGIQQLIREGEIEYARGLLKEIPLSEVELGQSFFLEEIQHCAENGDLETPPLFDTQNDMIAQNGCDVVIFRQDGTALTLPGQEARVLFNRYINQEQSSFLAKIFSLFQNTTSTPINSFRIYLNSGHASLAFDSDQKHFGFSPGGNSADLSGFVEEGAPSFLGKDGMRKFSKQPAKIGAFSGGRPSLTQKNAILTGVKSFGWFKKFFWQGDGTIQCRVSDNHQESIRSEISNQLTLQVFASKTQVQKIRDYVEKTKEDCLNGKAFYAPLGNNCVDFVQKGMQSTGFKGDFRDAFTNSQLARRFGIANLYSFAVSKGAPSLKFRFPSSLSEAFDAIPRNPFMEALKGAGAALTGYISFRTLPLVVQNMGLGASRIARVSAVLFEGALAIGRTFYRNSLFHR